MQLLEFLYVSNESLVLASLLSSAIVSVVGYYWMIEEVSDELGLGLIISSCVVTFILSIAVLINSRRKSETVSEGEVPT